MKEQIEKAVQKFGGWTAFETQIKGKSSRNFKRTVFEYEGWDVYGNQVNNSICLETVGSSCG